MKAAILNVAQQPDRWLVFPFEPSKATQKYVSDQIVLFLQ